MRPTHAVRDAPLMSAWTGASRGVVGWLLAVGVTLTVFCASAHADPRPLTISPDGAIQQVNTGEGLIDSPSFSLLVQATAGATLTCTLDDQPVGCGSAPPTCAGTVCAVFTASGESQGDHQLFVTDTDAAGHTVDQNVYDVSVDLTPPDTSNLLLDDQMENPRVLHPAFAFDVDDDSEADTSQTPLADSAQCSFTAVGAAPVWSPCPTYKGNDDEEDFQYTASVPPAHVDYLFQARAVDAFGRVDPTPVSMLYDPQPCTVKVAAPRTVRKLLGTALTATVQCTGTTSAVLELALLGTNGHAKPLNQVLRDSLPLIPPAHLNGHEPAFTARRRLQISDNDILIRAEKTVALARSLSLALVVLPVGETIYTPLPATAQFAIKARGGRGHPRGRALTRVPQQPGG